MGDEGAAREQAVEGTTFDYEGAAREPAVESTTLADEGAARVPAVECTTMATRVQRESQQWREQLWRQGRSERASSGGHNLG